MSAVAKVEAQQLEAFERGLCKCLCGEARQGRSAYANFERCRHRAHRARVAARARDMGLSGPLMLSHAQRARMAASTDPTENRRSDTQEGRKRPWRRNPSDARISLPRLERIALVVLGQDDARRLLDAVEADRSARTRR